MENKRLHLAKKKTYFDNALAHPSFFVMAQISGLKFELFPQPDLAPSHYHLLPNLNKISAVKKIESNGQIVDAVNEYFEGRDKLDH